ncbi:MAG: hypothetical protein ABSE28_02005 [Candidatus Sulfotelmatobacter sp.]|jgi:hypothetical protein
MLVGLVLLYKLLLTSILPFASIASIIASIEAQNGGQEAPAGAGYGKLVQNPVQ